MKQMKFRLADELIIDLFAGGGGASVGMERAIDQPVDIAINHWRDAIRVHEVNHPHTCHLHSDVFEVDPLDATGGAPVGLLWASPDCTYFSKARGSKPIREKGRKVRALAWVVVKWAKAVRPRLIILENVEEFRNWGPLDKNNLPVKDKAGFTFRRWKRELEKIGYVVEYRELVAADYGAPTTRKRLFVVARCDGLPIAWPEPTHGPGKKPYRAAHEIIDWDVPCPSIFERKRPLAEATMRRIARGIYRYVLNHPKPFIVKNNYGSKPFHGIDEPLHTVTSQFNRFSLVTPFCAPLTHQGDSRVYAPTSPMPTITGANRGEIALVAPHIQKLYGTTTGQGCNGPLHTVTGQGNHHALCAAFLARHWGGMTGKDLREPFPTITKKGCQDETVLASLAEPGKWPTKEAQVRAFLVKYFGTATGQSLQSPAHTATRKARLGLVTIAGQDYQIVDIGMRMLTPRELFRAQGFPEDYEIDVTIPKSAGAMEANPKRITKTSQIALAGNSVPPPVSYALARANMEVVG